MEDKKPSEGDLSVCAYCGTMFFFDSTLQLKKCTKNMEELFRKESPDAMNLIDHIRLAIQQHIRKQ
jgi:hypothetical protein